mmetsp:Transcript_13935/g.35200  ORF Transcript_13935/g.35200 Transcript_13935/m.35200 type:complete len:257 (+) Transcript_13935:176-946(+)
MLSIDRLVDCVGQSIPGQRGKSNYDSSVLAMCIYMIVGKHQNSNPFSSASQISRSVCGPLDAAVTVDGCKDQLTRVEFDLIGNHHSWGHAVLSVHQCHDSALGPVMLHSSIALHSVTDLEAQGRESLPLALRSVEASLKSFGELLLHQVPADEDKLALAGLILAPWLREVTSEQHVNSLVHKALLGMRNSQDALHSEDVRSLGGEKVANPFLHIIQIQLPRHANTHARHGGVVLMFAISIQELRIHVQRAGQIKSP